VKNIKYGYYRSLFDSIEKVGPLPDEIKELVTQKIERKNVTKNTIIQRKDTPVEHLYFVQSGFVRGVYFFDNVEVTTWLNGPGDFVVSISNFFGKVKTRDSVQAITDCQLIYIKVEDFFEIVRNNFQAFLVYQQMLEHYYFAAEERVFISKIPTSKERYQYFLKSQFYQTLQKVPDKYLADFLGIRAETLSRLKHS
jgi:CRP-like cAMP-binding protein